MANENDLIVTLQSLDPTILTRVVRLDQHSPNFAIGDLSVRRLSDRGIINPDGLWLFSGQGRDERGERPWSVVLKILNLPEGGGTDEDGYELLVARSGLTERLPGPVKAQRFYETQKRPEAAWIWMEHVQPKSSDPWRLEDYAFTARQIGRWNGAFLNGKALPREPWLKRQQYRIWINRDNNAEAYNFPLNQKYITGTTRARQERLWAEREQFFRVLESLPQVFSHFDLQRRNLFIRTGQDGRDELVAVDWAWCGIGSVGAELYSLVGGSVTLLEWPVSALPELDAVTFSNYLEGLREAGWLGEAELARLGYTAWLAVWWGCVFPIAFTFWASEGFRSYALQQFGVAGEAMYEKWMPWLEAILDYADEARQLASKLGMKITSL